MVNPIYLTVPYKYRNTFGKFYVRSSIHNILQFFVKKQNTVDVTKGFRERYKSGNLCLQYVDGAINWYLDILYHCEADLSVIPNNKDIMALDLGCGAASVGYWLRDNGYKWFYTGVDIIEEADSFFEPLEDAHFIHQNIENLNVEDIQKQPDIIFAINVFCYIPKIKDFIRSLCELSSTETKLVVIDPYPGIFWNRKSTAIHYTTKEMVSLLEKNGWHVEKVFQMSVYNVANFPIMLISHGFLCSRS